MFALPVLDAVFAIFLCGYFELCIAQTIFSIWGGNR